MNMRFLFLPMFGILFGPVTAAEAPVDHPAECRVAQHLIENDFPLPHVNRAIAAKHLNVLVLGAGSSTLPGPDGSKNAFPARLQVILTEKLPAVAIKVHTDVKSHHLATEMIKSLPADLAAFKPQLVIWQTGTVDAMQGVDQDEFSEALERGINIARAAGADVIFMNAQYSPHTESMIALGAYSENMRWVALQNESPIFDRYSIMKLWADLGIFNLYASTNKLDVAIGVHDCVGRLLADLVVNATKSKAPLVDNIH